MTNPENHKTMGDEVVDLALSLTVSYRVELALLSTVGGSFYLLYRRLGTVGAAIVLACMVTALALLPSVRTAVAKALYQAHQRRLFERAMNSLKSRFSILMPRYIKAEKVPLGTRLLVQLRAGSSVKDLESIAEHLKVFYRAMEVRVIPDQRDGSRIALTIKTKDPWGPDPITGSTLLGEEVDLWGSIPIGTDEEGEAIGISLFEHNLLIGGEPGSGKSVCLTNLVAAASADPSASIYLFDGKGLDLRAFAPISSGFVGPNLEAGIALLGEITTVMDERRRRLEQGRLRKATQDMGLVVVVIDELAYYVANGDTKAAKEFAGALRDLIARGRAAGVVCVMATQKPSADTVPSSIRDLVNLRIAFRCTTKDASDTVLGAGWASQGFSASSIPPVSRGVGFILSETGTPALFKSYYLDEAEIDYMVETARRARHVQ